MSKLLDYLGLLQFLVKLKTLFVTALGTSGNYLTWTKNGTTNNITVPYSSKTASIPFGYVDNTSTSTVYTVTVDGITELRDGVCFRVTNSKVTSESGCTLNVNQLGAKPMYSTGAAASRIATTFTKDRTYLLIYNETRVSGGCWDIGYLSDSNTTYSAITLSAIKTGTATTSRTVTAAVLADAYNISNGTITIGANSITPYQKPSGGIPSTDLASAVQTSLGKADTALLSHQDISGKEDKSNKVTSLSSSSTDIQYPSAKCVYDAINNINPRIPITSHGTSDTTFALTPNIYHKWGSVSSLTLTLVTPDDVSVMNEYIFSFTSPATPTTLSIPASVNWVTPLDIEPNKEYRVSIIDNLATWITSDMVVPIGDVNTPEFATKAYVDAGLALKEDSSNKVTSVDENSTNTQYPSAKAMYDALNPE